MKYWLITFEHRNPGFATTEVKKAFKESDIIVVDQYDTFLAEEEITKEEYNQWNEGEG